MKPSLDISCCWWIDGTQSDSLQLNLQPLQLEKWAASKTEAASHEPIRRVRMETLETV